MTTTVASGFTRSLKKRNFSPAIQSRASPETSSKPTTTKCTFKQRNTEVGFIAVMELGYIIQQRVVRAPKLLQQIASDSRTTHVEPNAN